MKFLRTSPTFTVFHVVITLLIFFSIGVRSTANGQGWVEYNDGAERRFLDAIRYFKAGNFYNAHREFLAIYSDLPMHQRTTAAYIMHGKTLSRMGYWHASNEVLSSFLEKFPASLYVDDARYTMGLNALRKRALEDAIREFLWVIDENTDPLLTANAEPLVRSIVGEILPMNQVKQILREFSGRPSGDFLRYVTAERFYTANDFEDARETLDVLVRESPEGRYTGRAQALLRQIEGGGSVKIGVLLPLHSISKDVALHQLGEQFLAGARLAAADHNNHPRSYTKVDLEIRDTERDPVVASRVIQELVDDPEIVAIVGPIFSAEVFATAGVANAKGVPLISPTANANGIASVGQYIFQANPDYSKRGKAMAQYAIRNHGFRAVAVLAPIDAVGKYMAESFIEEATRLGATIVATEWYGRGTTDLYPQFRSIREKGLIAGTDPLLMFSGKLKEDFIEKLVGAGVSPDVIDSLMEIGEPVGVTDVLGVNGRRIADSLGFPVTYPDLKLDSLYIPVTAIEAIYIPIASSDDIGIVSSQLVYYNIEAQILGTGDWHDFAELEANKRYADGVMFTSDSYVHPEDSTYQYFLQRVLERMSVRATNNTLFVYDTMKFLFTVVNDGAMTRDQIAESLAGIRKFKGLHAPISLSERVNSELHILQYKGGKIRSIDNISVDEVVVAMPP